VSTPLTTLARAASGFGLAFEGARLLLRERQLWTLALVPFALSLLAVTTASVLVVRHAAALHAAATFWLPALEAGSWIAWIWIGPATALLHLAGALLFLALVGVCLVMAYLLASLLAAPFHDLLSQRVERLLTGEVFDAAEPGVRALLGDAARSLLEEGRRLAFFLALVGPLALLGWIVPPLQVVTAPAVLLATMLFLPLDYASYTLDRRRLPFRAKRRWLLAHAPVMLGFGAAGFLTCLVPLLNFAAMPVLVVSGTLLALRLPPAAGAQPSGAAQRADSGAAGPP